MNLDNYQKEIEKILGPIRHPRIGCAIGLSEEAGEVSKEIMSLEIYGTDGSREKLAGEIADVFISLSELASSYDINLEQAIANKISSLKQSAPKWVEKFGQKLAEKRKKLD